MGFVVIPEDKACAKNLEPRTALSKDGLRMVAKSIRYRRDTCLSDRKRFNHPHL